MAISALGILVICFLSNASVLLPSASILIVVEYSMLISPFLAVLCGAFGASLGEMTGFYVGLYTGNVYKKNIYRCVKPIISAHPYIIVFLFSVLPLPVFDVIGILSGVMKLNSSKFFCTCFTGKLIKMLLYVWLTRKLFPVLN